MDRSTHFSDLFKNFTDTFQSQQEDATEDYLSKQQDMQFGMNSLFGTWYDFYNYLLKNPEKFSAVQMNYFNDYLKLYQSVNEKNATQNSSEESPGPPKKEYFLLDFIQKSHELSSEYLKKMSEAIAQKDEKLGQKIQFYGEQFLAATSPANFLLTNPDVQKDIQDSGGETLAKGFQNFLQDVEDKKYFPDIKTTDLKHFSVGKNLAITPGKVIYQNDLIQLIQYQSSTPKNFKVPLLIIPPWINKYYILDLQSHNSLMKFLIDQGHTVFMISWVNPDEHFAEKEFSNYMLEGPLAAAKIIQKMTGEPKINAVGYCVGGTLLASTLAYLSAQKKVKNPFASTTYLATLIDFSEPGNIGVFLEEWQIAMLEKRMAKKGYLEGRLMFTAFNLLRVQPMIWANFVNNYLRGKDFSPLDLLYWNSDSANIPAKVHSFYLRQMYLYNNLIKPGKIELNGVPLDISKVSLPTYYLAAKEDHITLWNACYKGLQQLSGDRQFVLTGSGHVAGIINPPEKKKYGYWTNDSLPSNHQDWLEQARQQEGSWWLHWANWLKEHGGGEVPARTIVVPTAQKFIEDAPGSYVKMKCNEHKEVPLASSTT